MLVLSANGWGRDMAIYLEAEPAGCITVVIHDVKVHFCDGNVKHQKFGVSQLRDFITYRS